MNESWKAFSLGLFIIVAVGLTAWLILFLKPSVGDGELTLIVRFSNIEKVAEGTLVTFAGRQVGEVKRIKTIEDPRRAPADSFGNLYIYELTLEVDSSVRVYLYDEIIFATAGLLGEKSIAINPKAPPPGAPPSYEVTHQTLYARSTDKLDQTLTKLVTVADTFEGTLEEVNIFIESNSKEFNETLRSLRIAAHEIHKFVGHTTETDVFKKTANAMLRAEAFFANAQENMILDRLGSSFDSLHEAAALFSKGEGTVARLVNSDCLYVQLTTILCQLQTVLSDMKNFGLLYQFDRKWQRLNEMRRCCTEIQAEPYCDR
jgi:phospholipid/cholesterol/gamma-HCH transport system substrate-binding protein